MLLFDPLGGAILAKRRQKSRAKTNGVVNRTCGNAFLILIKMILVNCANWLRINSWGSKMKLINSAAIAAMLVAAAGTAEAASTFFSTDAPQAINDFSTITSTLTATGGAINDVNLILGDIRHTSVADLDITLTAPDGTSIRIIDSFTDGGILLNLGTPDNFIDTVIDDQAATSLRSGSAPYSGSFNVDYGSISQPLSGFVGLNAAGVWTLTITDEAGADIGTLNAWGLEIDAAVPAVPLPAAAGPLLLAGLAGL